jgi:hypothetical protein
MSISPTPAPAFGTQTLGETEKALGGILRQQLSGTGLTEPLWVTLTIALAGTAGGPVDRDELAGRVAGVFKVADAEAQDHLAELAAAGLLADGAEVTVTDAGRRLHARIRAEVAPITERLWGDLPAEDLATAARVLSTILERANAELAPA